VSFAAAVAFLILNGVRLTAAEADAHDGVIGIVEGRYSEPDVMHWIRTNSETAGEEPGSRVTFQTGEMGETSGFDPPV